MDQSNGEQRQEQPRAIPLREAARLAGVSVQALRQATKRGTLTPVDAIDDRGRTVAGVLLDELRAQYPGAFQEQGEEQSGAIQEQSLALVLQERDQRIDDLRAEITFLRGSMLQKDAQLGELARLPAPEVQEVVRGPDWKQLLWTGSLIGGAAVAILVLIQWRIGVVNANERRLDGVIEQLGGQIDEWAEQNREVVENLAELGEREELTEQLQAMEAELATERERADRAELVLAKQAAKRAAEIMIRVLFGVK